MAAAKFRSVTVRVPATSANMGPGFDSVGIALNLFNDLTVRLDPPPPGGAAIAMTVEGEGADTLPRDDSNICVRALSLAFREAGYASLPPLSMHLVNRIPIGAGLGSSSAAIVAGLLAGLALTGTGLSVEREEKALQIAASIEGHVDNLAPCIYGGMQIGVHTGSRWYTTSVNVPQGLQCILFTPDARQDTESCRALLPPTVSRHDAVYNIGRVALLVNAFASGALDDLSLATQDALHQPARSGIMPALTPCIEAAMKAGAKGAFLSGAGSSIMAITTGRKGDIFGQRPTERCDALVARAMIKAAAGVGLTGRVILTHPTATGAHVIAVDDDPGLVVSGRLLGVDMEDDTDAGSTASARAGGLAVPLPRSVTVAPAAASEPSVQYVSTRDAAATRCGFIDVVMRGMAPDGGLYVPASIPTLDRATLMQWCTSPLPPAYADVAYAVMRAFVKDDELPADDLRRLCAAAYQTNGDGAQWAHAAVMPLVHLRSSLQHMYVLEQFHGPTCAFKDAALQLLGRLFEYVLARRARASGKTEDGHMTILGATSGDTGSAAIAGLRGRKGVQTFICHPAGRVAKIQELQMSTVMDANVHNIAVTDATFDDCQAMVKAAFADARFAAATRLSAVNSINWARVLAQVAYYWWAYVQLARADASIVAGTSPTEVTYVVPTGNFGNALAGWYAKRMGLPVAKVVVATNANDILHRYVLSGDYSVKGAVTPTLAPSMDIQLASNLERYVYHALDGDAAATRAEMQSASSAGCFSAAACGDAVMTRIRSDFTSHAATDAVISEVIERYAAGPARYVACPHTATGFAAVDALPSTAIASHVICLATAHPAKFAAETVSLQRIGYADASGRPAEPAPALTPAWPQQLRDLERKPRQMATLPRSVDTLKDYVTAVIGV